MSDSIDSSEEHVISRVIGHWVLLRKTKEDRAKAGSKGKVMATWAVNTASQTFSLFKVDSVHTGDLKSLNGSDFDVTIDMTNHSVLFLLWRGYNETYRAKCLLWECIDRVEHLRCQKLDIAINSTDTSHEDIGVQIVSQDIDLVRIGRNFAYKSDNLVIL